MAVWCLGVFTASLASFRDFYDTPFAAKGKPYPVVMWSRLECPNTVFTARHLPQVLAFLSFTTVRGRRTSRRPAKGITGAEVKRLAAIFGVSPQQLTTQCANCSRYRPPDSPA